MKKLIYETFEGGLFNEKGFGGGSINVKVMLNKDISAESELMIRQVIDRFDHATFTDEKNLELLEDKSYRLILCNQEVYEHTYAICIFNLIQANIEEDTLLSVEINDSEKSGYIVESGDNSVNVNFKYLRGE